jgi:hypothetical protein
MDKKGHTKMIGLINTRYDVIPVFNAMGYLKLEDDAERIINNTLENIKKDIHENFLQHITQTLMKGYASEIYGIPITIETHITIKTERPTP